MKINYYKVLSNAVEEGIAYGYNRAYKYTDVPTEEQMQRDLYDAIMSQICEYFEFCDYDDAN